MPYGLKDSVIKKLQNAFEDQWEVETVVLFGSRAKGNYRPGSDIDLAVKGRNYTYHDNLSLSAKLDDLNLPYKIDLINYDTIKDKDVIEHIERVGVVFYRRWKEHKLGDFIDIKHGFAFKGKFISTELTNNILVTPGNFHIGGGFKQDKFKYYNGDYPDEYILSEGNVVITMTDLSQETDTLGYSAIIPKQNGFKFLHNQRIGLVNFVSNKADKGFIYWLLRTDEYHGFIVGSASGTSIMHTSPSRIKEYSFFLPPLPDQTTIASVLSSLDDKIDLLHRQNKTLEQLAETLFRKWFVECAEDSWEVVKLSSFGEIICGKTPSKKIAEFFGGKIPFIKIPDMHREIFVFETEDSLTEAGLNSQSNKTISEKSICVSCIATVGLIVMNAKTAQTNQQINSIIPNKEHYRYFIYLKMRSMKKELLAMASGGTATDNLNTGDFSNIDIMLPNEQMLIDFHNEVQSMFDKIFNNQTQIRTLTRLRDTLLPKLMSGEVRVKM